MDIEIEGFDEVEEALDDMLESVSELEGTNEIPFVELFPPRFIRPYTEFNDIEDFFEQSPWEVESQQDFRDIPGKSFDKYVNENTDFPNWEVMKNTAGKQYIERQFS